MISDAVVICASPPGGRRCGTHSCHTLVAARAWMNGDSLCSSSHWHAGHADNKLATYYYLSKSSFKFLQHASMVVVCAHVVVWSEIHQNNVITTLLTNSSHSGQKHTVIRNHNLLLHESLVLPYYLNQSSVRWFCCPPNLSSIVSAVMVGPSRFSWIVVLPPRSHVREGMKYMQSAPLVSATMNVGEGTGSMYSTYFHHQTARILKRWIISRASPHSVKPWAAHSTNVICPNANQPK